jgi:hypothetical protein
VTDVDQPARQNRLTPASSASLLFKSRPEANEVPSPPDRGNKHTIRRVLLTRRMSRIPLLIIGLRIFLALVVIGLGAALISKSEPAASLADEQGIVEPVDPAVNVPAPTPTPLLLAGGVLPHPRAGAKVEYTVCTTNGSWTRPSRELEATHLATAAVHATFEDIASQFRAPFWRDAGNEGSVSALLELSGLWTASDNGLDVAAMVNAGCAASPSLRPGLVNLWLLGSVATDVRIENGRIFVYTTPRIGFQTIQLRFTGSENPKIMPIDFMNPAGYRMETIPANSTWSAEP